MRRALVATALLALLLPGGAALADAIPLPPVAPFKDISRVVVIGGSLLEIVYALGEERHVAARDITGDYPEAANKLPDVGYMRALSPEGVLSVNPSAILAIEGSGPPEAMAILSKAGIPFDEVPESFSHAGIVNKVLAVGTALGVEDKAKALAQKLDAELSAAEAVGAEAPAKKRVLFVLSLQGGKVTASGTGTAADGIIRMAGAVNAVSDYEGYKTLNDEAVIAARPDVILIMDNGGDHSASDAKLLASPGVSLTPAGQSRDIVRMDGEYLLGFGPRTPDAIRQLVGHLYPDLPGKD